MFRRGFKTQCERRAAETRRSLGLSTTSPLSARALADFLAVTVWSAGAVEGLADQDRHQLLETAPREWSAFVLREGDRFLIVYNPEHSLARVNSDLMHELSHIMLGHELGSAGQTEDGHLLLGNYDKEQEDEANWLGGTLLLPRSALLWMRGRRMSDQEAAAHFAVSVEMVRWRVRVTGVDYQFARAG